MVISTANFPKALVGGKDDRKKRQGVPSKVGKGQKLVPQRIKQGRGR